MTEINKELRPRGGVGVYIINERQELLLLLRNSVHAAGFWCPPGGHIEYGESFLQAAVKETKEESDINVSVVETIGVTGDVYPAEQKHYITVHLKAVKYDGEAKLMEPNKFSALKWWPLQELPANIFPAVKSFLEGNPPCLCGSEKKYKFCHGRDRT
ncbi:MAG: NUDIX domain-containing protein [Candidatus Falkowbacteria bacterium]|nr:NUDIX domain-containing protein [Candidatus Falkowbacteria bacterium]